MANLSINKWCIIILIFVTSSTSSSDAEELVPFVEIASNQDCGVNCLLIACQMYDISAEKTEIAALAKLSLEGTSLFNLSDAARSKGLHTKMVRWQFNQLARWPHLAIEIGRAHV